MVGALALRIHIFICVAAGINRDASTRSVLKESIDWECTKQIVSITLYVRSRLLDLDFS